jgi:F-type H+-transporting ATPase subunit delta
MESAPQTRPHTVMDPTQMSVGEMYAQSLLDTLPDDAQAQEVAQELEALAGVLNSIPEAANLLSGWAMSTEDRSTLIQRLFAGRVSEKMEAFLTVLNRRNRMVIFPAVVRGFRRLLDRREGKIEVTLTTAVPLDDEQKTRIGQELDVALAGKAVVKLRVDENLLGGAVLRIGDHVYNASLRSELMKFKETIAARRMDVKAK